MNTLGKSGTSLQNDGWMDDHNENEWNLNNILVPPMMNFWLDDNRAHTHMPHQWRMMKTDI